MLVNSNHKGQLVYITLPILVIWNVSANLLSQEEEVTKDNSFKQESIYTS